MEVCLCNMQGSMPALVFDAVLCVCPFNCHHRIQEMKVLDDYHVIGTNGKMQIGIIEATHMTGTPPNYPPTLNDV